MLRRPHRPTLRRAPRWGGVLVLLAAAGCGEAPHDTGSRGSAEPGKASLALLDLDGRSVDPLAVPAEAVARVFLFTRSDCPISNRYAPETQRIVDAFAPRGVAFRLVYPDPHESADSIRAHREEYGYRVEALRDPEHALVGLTGAEVTPEAAVFDAAGSMVYRGRIDDRYVAYGQARVEANERDLVGVLEALVAGASVEPYTTEAIGCLIEDLR